MKDFEENDDISDSSWGKKAQQLKVAYSDYNPGFVLDLRIAWRKRDLRKFRILLEILVKLKTVDLQYLYPFEILEESETANSEKFAKEFTDFLIKRRNHLQTQDDYQYNLLILKELFIISDHLQDGQYLCEAAKLILEKDFQFMENQVSFSKNTRKPYRRNLEDLYWKFHESKLQWNNTLEEKIKAFCHVFSEVKYNSASLKISPVKDWDSHAYSYLPELIKATSKLEFYEKLAEMVHKVGDNHNFIQFPYDITRQFIRPALAIVFLNGSYYIAKNQEFQGKEIQKGDEIIQIQNLAVQAYIDQKKNLYPFVTCSHFLPEKAVHTYMADILLYFYKDQSLSVKLKKQDKSEYELSFTQEKYPEAKKSENNSFTISSELCEDGILYINIPAFWGGDIYGLFMSEISRYETDAIKGMILDVRQNRGGSSVYGDKIFAHFVPKDFLNYQFDYTKIHVGHYQVRGVTDLSVFSSGTKIKADHSVQFRFPVVVLTSTFTGSAAEDFVFLFKYYHRALILGTQTSGSTGNSWKSILPGSGFIRVNLDISRYFSIRGIEPDLYWEQNLNDLVEGKDSQLEKAKEILSQSTRGSGSEAVTTE